VCLNTVRLCPACICQVSPFVIPSVCLSVNKAILLPPPGILVSFATASLSLSVCHPSAFGPGLSSIELSGMCACLSIKISASPSAWHQMSGRYVGPITLSGTWGSLHITPSGTWGPEHTDRLEAETQLFFCMSARPSGNDWHLDPLQVNTSSLLFYIKRKIFFSMFTGLGHQPPRGRAEVLAAGPRLQHRDVAGGHVALPRSCRGSRPAGTNQN
jgi:hypothetical protein